MAKNYHKEGIFEKRDEFANKYKKMHIKILQESRDVNNNFSLNRFRF